MKNLNIKMMTVPLKSFSSILIILTIIGMCLIIYIKYYEKKAIYFPSPFIEVKPKDIGLDYQDIYFLTSDGVKLNAWFIEAENPIATILFLHGNAGNISHRIKLIQLFVKEGFSFFIFDWRGYGKSKGRPSEEGLYKDALASYEYLTKKLNILPNKIVIYGKSLGANIACDLATKVDKSLLIIDSGFSSAQDMAKIVFPFIPSFLVRWAITVKFDALSKIKEIAFPKLIIHSKDDETIPFNQGEKLFREAKEPKEFFVVRGSHNQAIFNNPEVFISRIKTFVLNYSNKDPINLK